MTKKLDEYIEMQTHFYEPLAEQWRPELPHRNHVVGWFEEHNAWPGYEHLFAGIDTKDMIALDFGCGPGRGIVKYWNRFKRVDGTDLVQKNLDNAKWWMRYNRLDESSVNLYKCNGYNLENIPSDSYDFIFSMICFQHICSYEIRLSYLREFARVLKPGGYVAMQMGYGKRLGSLTRDYKDNFFDSSFTNGDGNGAGDVSVTNLSDLESDLNSVGLSNFTYVIDEPFLGEHDTHPKWIYFRAQKGSAS